MKTDFYTFMHNKYEATSITAYQQKKEVFMYNFMDFCRSTACEDCNRAKWPGIMCPMRKTETAEGETE